MFKKTNIKAWSSGARVAASLLVIQRDVFITPSFIPIIANIVVAAVLDNRKEMLTQPEKFPRLGADEEEIKRFFCKWFTHGVDFVIEEAEKVDIAFLSDGVMHDALVKVRAEALQDPICDW